MSAIIDLPRFPGLRRGISACALALLTVVCGGLLAAPAPAAEPRSQTLVMLGKDHVARTAPDAGAPVIETVAARRPLTHVRTVLPVLDDAKDADRRSWVQVRLPGRPNAHKGWILASQTTPTETEWRISLKLSTRRITVYRDGLAARRFKAVVGKASTPTPVGRFFVEEAVEVEPGHPGGPFALAVSARSEVLQEFGGGPGQIAIHGTKGLSGALGSAASHGCVRVSTRDIKWLAKRIGAGVPLVITR